MGQRAQSERPIDVLPRWRGLPVPYIARWRGELVTDQFTLATATTGEQFVRYKDEIIADRDARSVLWARHRYLVGRTEPEFAQVHAYRQRRCMRKRCCQVCGQRISAGPVLFLMVQREVESLRADPITFDTATPPVCEWCAEDAPRWCPALRGGMALVRADFVDVGIVGQSARTEDGVTASHELQSRVRYDDPELLARTIASNVLIVLRDWQEQ